MIWGPLYEPAKRPTRGVGCGGSCPRDTHGLRLVALGYNPNLPGTYCIGY